MALPQVAWGQSIEDALIMAYHSNPTLLAQRAQVRAVDEQVPQALSNWRPTVSFSGEFKKAIQTTDAKLSTTAMIVENTDNLTPQTYTLTVTQPLFRGFRTIAETDRAEARVLAERARLADTEQTTFNNVISSYMDVVQNQAVLELNMNNEQVLTRQLEATRDRFEVGEVTRTDVSQAEARLARAVADREKAEGDLATARATYQRVVGEIPGNLLAPASPTNLPENLEQAVLLARDHNPSVVAALYDERAAKEDIGLIEGELLPSLDIEGQYSRATDVSSRATDIDTKSVALQLTVPLYQSGSVYSRVREAKQTASRSMIQIEEARRSAIETATRAWEDLQTARSQVGAFQKESDSNQIALEGTEQEATAGLRTVLDILDAEQELLNSRVDLVKSQRNEVVAAYQVVAATGRLTARELALPVPYYDPAAHYEDVRDKFIGLGGDVE
ncbi:MAG: TolC family outer membrane protein [Rhodospirillaceae bacterium]|nr:TolC family outer membrane protein [Rhodospirillaceae bacterium]MBT6119556.1 TolC family outer membrane protein [Rhodospirillaceae bacterium]